MLDRTDAAARYYQRLDSFVALCLELVDRGQPWTATVLCHELYRFLYPVEPFAGFVHTDPVEHALQNIERLIASGQTMLSSVSPYRSGAELSEVKTNRSLEIATSDLYSSLWTGFREEELATESVELVSNRLPENVVRSFIQGKRVLDMGCGSGRYSVALARLGAKRVDAVDVQAKAYRASERLCEQRELNVHFQEASVHSLPFEDGSFDFVFCNGVLHHTSSIEKGLDEFARVMKKDGRGFLYLYGAGGIFWDTRRELRKVFMKIPLAYARAVLDLIGMPSKRFIFCDTWYVPIEGHTQSEQLDQWLGALCLRWEKVPGRNAFDLDRKDLEQLPGWREMWGNGEHRYLVWKE